ncbi:MAG: hypothetical protein R3236_08105, partial [Phycisphaeraceae bacterium]|nr:hypothetical protein [Phycisphaeraceae bacterium]
EEHLDRANSRTRSQPVKVTKTLEEYKNLYVGDRDTMEGPEGEYYAKVKKRMEKDPRPDMMVLHDLRQHELDKSISHLTSLATEKGRPAQQHAAELALAEQIASKAIYRATQASNRWADHMHLVSRSTEDASQIRLFSSKASVLTNTQFTKGREAVSQERQKANTRLEQLNQTISKLQTDEIDKAISNIAKWAKERDEAYIAADKSSREAFTKTGEEKANLELAAVKSRDKARELELKIDRAKTDLRLATAAKEVADKSKAALTETLSRLDEAEAAIDQRVVKNAAIIAHCYEAMKLSLDGFGGEKAPGKGFDKNVKTLIDLMQGEVAEAFAQADEEFAQALTHLKRAQELAKGNKAAKNIVALQQASTHANRAHLLHRKMLAYQGFERMLKFIDENLTVSETDKRVDAAAAATAAAAQMREAAGKAEDAQIKSRIESGASLAENAGPRISTVHEQVKAALTEVTAMIETDKESAKDQFAKATEAANNAATHKDPRVKQAANKQLAHVMIGNGHLTGNAEDVKSGIMMLKSSEAQKKAPAPSEPPADSGQAPPGS